MIHVIILLLLYLFTYSILIVIVFSRFIFINQEDDYLMFTAYSHLGNQKTQFEDILYEYQNILERTFVYLRLDTLTVESSKKSA